MRSTRSWFASSFSRAFSRHPSVVLAAVVMLPLFAVAPSWATGVTAISWNTTTGQNRIGIPNQSADLVFETNYSYIDETVYIEARDANEYGLPIIPLASLNLPESIHLQGYNPTFGPWSPPYNQDDDNTPDQQEIVVRLVGVTPLMQSSVLEAFLVQGGGGCQCGHEDARVRLAQVDGAASPTAVTLRVLRETPLGGGISFAVGLPAETRARVDVFDISGRRLRTISNGVLPSGVTTLKWDGRDDAGERARPGIVFARLSTPREVRSARLVLGPGIH